MHPRNIRLQKIVDKGLQEVIYLLLRWFMRSRNDADQEHILGSETLLWWKVQTDHIQSHHRGRLASLFKLEWIKTIHVETEQVTSLIVGTIVNERMAVGTRNFVQPRGIPYIIHGAIK